MPFFKGPQTYTHRSREIEKLAKINGYRHAIFSPQNDKYIGQWRDNIKEGTILFRGI